jgi:unsaturated chondroitin disaccharide hydrolase
MVPMRRSRATHRIVHVVGVVTAVVTAVVLLGGVIAAPPAASAAARLAPLVNADQRLTGTYQKLRPGAYPVRTTPNGSITGTWLTRGATDWTSGFYSGALWRTYERTRNANWMTMARNWQNGLAGEASRSDTDLGFKMMYTFARDYDLTRNANSRTVALRAAQTLSTRYNAKVGMIKSWDDPAYAGRFETNIDALMNTELLFWAAANGGSANYRTIAVSHATRALRDLVRPDGSTWMYMSANPTTGVLLGHHTKQGYATESTWSRGQAWAVYGFTMAYRYTKDPKFLDGARRTADLFLNRLPADRVAPWDFDAPDGATIRDSSASAIVASALLELRTYETDAARKQNYDTQTTAILRSLSSAAYSPQTTTFPAILAHGTQHKPHNQFDTGIMFGDYYYVEGLGRYEKQIGPTTALTS